MVSDEYDLKDRPTLSIGDEEQEKDDKIQRVAPFGETLYSVTSSLEFKDKRE